MMKLFAIGSLCFMLIQWITEVQAIGIRFSHNGVEMEYNRRNAGDRSEREYVCECKCYSKVMKDGWDCCECPWTESVCFPGDVMVTVEPDVPTKMSELKPKDRVLAVTENGNKVFSEVRTFLKRLPEDLAVYLDVITVDDQMISLSESHVIFSSSISNSSSFYLHVLQED
uniref:Lophotrochozoan hedgehog-related n=1 Tax=Lottia cf. kogamogai ALO-2016 TaxID=1918952 RepID=A0A1J0M5S2_9GAST|nr:lophotrochozoan hedgehog-related [Lottia cf. kogamogai ALO-2016]